MARRRNEPIFFENEADDNHCLQAAIMIVLNSLGHPVRRDHVNAGTQFEKSLYSWTIQGAAYIAEFTPGVRMYSDLDYRRFANEGESYLQSTMSPDWFSLQKSKASKNFEKEQTAAQFFMERGIFENKHPSKKEMFEALDKHLLISLTALERLYPERKPNAHFIVLYASDGDMVWLHDPGLPPKRSVRLKQQHFYDAYQGDLVMVPLGNHKFGWVE